MSTLPLSLLLRRSNPFRGWLRVNRWMPVLLAGGAALHGVAGAEADVTAPLSIDADFPGGNILVDRIEGDTVHLRQDLRDTEGWWFYWSFRVSGAKGRTLRFDFGERSPIGVRGPALSLDRGATWRWLGEDAVEGAAFTYAFPEAQDGAWFAFTVPYQEVDLQRFLAKCTPSPALVEETLCVSRKGRKVEALRLGRLVGEPQHRLLLTARHHACETMASFALEGFAAAVLAEDETGAWYRDNVEILAVPFVDKDGVEDGDQGKNRRPRDHNRDYGEASIYPETAALRERVPAWSAGKLRAALDLHCPYIRGKHNEEIYIVGSADKAIWKQQEAFGAILEAADTGPLPYHASSNLPFGEAWNTAKNYAAGKSFGRWAGEIPGIDLAATFEIPYANASGAIVTPESARAFGQALAEAMRIYLSRPAAQ